jgi:NAD-dependent dihydropyrimidine dehydrogenase PreA subunit
VHRTVPSACGEYLVDLYLVDETGVYQYFGKRHYLHRIRQDDFREKVCELLGSPFENPAALFLFARRDKMRFTPEGEGYEEACFSAQNMSLVAASMGFGIGFASIKPEARGEAWAPILGKPEALERIPYVGGQDNIASPPARPFAVAAAGWPAEKDLRWRKAEDEPLAFAPPAEDRPEGSRAAEAGSPVVDVAKEIFPEAKRFKPGGEEALYYIALKRSLKKDGMDASQTLGFAADTFRVVPEVLGYHGPIHIALGLNPYGRIKDLRIFDHTESEEHMNRILDSDFLEAFKGKSPGEMAGVDIVSGATVTCVAMARAIQTAQQRLCGATGLEGSAARGEDPGVLLKGAALAFFFTAAFCLLRAHKGWRLGLLLLAACFLGWVWNWSFTYTDLLTGAGLFGVLTALLITLVLVSTLLKGRIYCGWICPFGAVQELIKVCADRLFPRIRRAGPLSKQGQGLKYAVLLALLAAAVITGVRGFLNPEPFSVFFGWNTSSWRLYVGLAALALSLVISRPFCRYLCPSGALLACLHRLKGGRETHPAFSACQGCGRCRRACPTSAVEWSEEENRVLGRNRFECIGCEECVKATAQGPCREAREGRSV